ncbi:unnamed protein product [Lasius platythorax]|uniref:Uncharacterized protein n=1 Tax=Lasius platythorax TaxID=488582 RepID=A0AAV2N3F7_9HYME
MGFNFPQSRSSKQRGERVVVRDSRSGETTGPHEQVSDPFANLRLRLVHRIRQNYTTFSPLSPSSYCPMHVLVRFLQERLRASDDAPASSIIDEPSPSTVPKFLSVHNHAH